MFPDVCPADDLKKTFNIPEKNLILFSYLNMIISELETQTVYKGGKHLKAAFFLTASRGRCCPDEFVVSVFSFKSY